MSRPNTIPELVAAAAQAGMTSDVQTLDALRDQVSGWMIPEDEKSALHTMLDAMDQLAEYVDDDQ